MATYSILYSAVVSSSASNGSPGDVLILSTDGTTYVKATAANRGTRRSTGIAMTSYVVGGVVDIAQTGQISTVITGFTPGAASWVRCSAAGTLEKVTPGAGDDLLGKVDEDGRFFLDPGKWDASNYSGGGGGGGSTPTGTGIPHVIAGVQNPAASLIVDADVDNAAAVDGTKIVPDFGTQDVITTGSAFFGTLPATAGYIGLPMGDGIRFRNSAAIDVPMVLSAGDALYVGTDNTFTTQAAAISIYAGASGAVGLGLAGSTYAYLSGGATESWVPITGSALASSPYGLHGVGTQAMADADQVVAASIYRYNTLVLTDALTADRTLTLPSGGASDPGGYRMWIDNACTGLFGVTVTTGAGDTWRVINGRRCLVLIDSRGVTPLSSPLAYGISGAGPGTSACGGTASTAPGSDSFCYGNQSTSSGDGSICFGQSSTASQTYSIAIGPFNTSSGAASVCIGEFSVSSGANSNVTGYSSTSTGNYSNVLGSYCHAYSTGSTAIGISAVAERPGELTHSSGCTEGSGLHGLDLYRELAATPGNLLLQDNLTELTLGTLHVVHMQVRLMAAQTAGAAKFASETHILTINVQAGAITLIRDTTIDGAGTIAAQGWSVTISTVFPDLILRFACNPGADTVRFFARCDWSQIGNL